MRPEKSEVNRLLCDNSMICNLTDWKCEVSLKEGIARTIEWFKIKENLLKYKHNVYNV